MESTFSFAILNIFPKNSDTVLNTPLIVFFIDVDIFVNSPLILPVKLVKLLTILPTNSIVQLLIPLYIPLIRLFTLLTNKVYIPTILSFNPIAEVLIQVINPDVTDFTQPVNRLYLFFMNSTNAENPPLIPPANATNFPFTAPTKLMTPLDTQEKNPVTPFFIPAPNSFIDFHIPEKNPFIFSINDWNNIPANITIASFHFLNLSYCFRNVSFIYLDINVIADLIASNNVLNNPNIVIVSNSNG